MTSAALALLFATATQTYNLPPGLLSALCWVESDHVIEKINFNDNGASSVGVCQMRLATARFVGFKGPRHTLQEPSVNIDLAGRYLRWQLRRYHGDIRRAVSGYNAGSFRLNDYGQVKNRRYVNKVFQAWAEGK